MWALNQLSRTSPSPPHFHRFHHHHYRAVAHRRHSLIMKRNFNIVKRGREGAGWSGMERDAVRMRA